MIDHFDFRGRPFTKEIPAKETYRAKFLDDEVDSVIEAISMRMSALIVAPPGQGKTVLLRCIRERLPETRYEVHYLKVPRLSGRDLCREISRAVGAKTAGTYASLVRNVQEKMDQSSSDQGVRPVIMLDDAHALRDQGYELLKILSNFEMDAKLVVSFVLAGHQGLKERLYRPDLTDVRQRIIHCGQLRLLSRDESMNYLQHRLSLVGCQTAPFDEAGMETLYDMSRGNMRALDNLALKSLSHAAKNGVKVVGHNEVATAGATLWN